MALALKISRTLIGDDGLTVTIADNTGTYNASTNPTGWGSPNPDRADFALILFVVEKASTGDVVITPTVYTPSSGDETDVTVWSFTNNIGGWYEYYMLAVKEWNASDTWEVGELTYASGVWYKSKQNSNNNHAVSDTAWWEEITATDYIDLIETFRTAEQLEEVNDNDLLYYVAYDSRMDIIVYNVDVKINRYLVAANCECNDICELSDYTKYRIKYYAMMIHFAKKSYSVAQTMYERLYRQLSGS